jgi:5-methylcytosine-specific restriction protein A
MKRERLRGRKWTAIRKRKLSVNPLCERCEKEGRVTLAEEIDHIVPIDQGGSDEDSNLMSLCVDCHYKKTQSEQGNAFKVRYGIDGLPIDKEHHWNR